LMDTNLQDGETQVICGPCLPAYALGMAAALTQGMTAEAATLYGPALDAIYANDPRAPKIDRLRPGAKRKSGKPEQIDAPLDDTATVAPSEAATAAKGQWVEANGGEAAIKRRMAADSSVSDAASAV